MDPAVSGCNLIDRGYSDVIYRVFLSGSTWFYLGLSEFDMKH